MGNFYSTKVSVGRKPHRCSQCGGLIEVGVRHNNYAQFHDGDFRAFRAHIDCDDAWHKLNFTLRGLRPDDEPFSLIDDGEFEDGERDWMRESFPTVATRLGWTAATLSPEPTEGA